MTGARSRWAASKERSADWRGVDHPCWHLKQEPGGGVARTRGWWETPEPAVSCWPLWTSALVPPLDGGQGVDAPFATILTPTLMAVNSGVHWKPSWGGQLWPGWDPKSLHSKARAGAGRWGGDGLPGDDLHQWQKAT